MSLFHSPNHESIEHTSNRRRPPICILNDDALLNIFHIYQLHIRDRYEDENGAWVIDWKSHRWWYRLAQVSRRWRHLILSSRSLLDLHLLCTYGVPVEDMLAHSPPLPLTIFYNNRDREMTAEDEEGTLLALSHRDRVHRIAICMLAPTLGKFITAMDEQFPILDQLSILSPNTEETALVLPQTFQAPNLCHLYLWYTALPIRSPLLISTGGLVHLWLGDIPRSSYFPPSYILTRLSLMPQLQRLGILFRSPLPNRDVVRQVSDSLIMTHVTLLNLRVFAFRGVSAYLEGLLARIRTPVLCVLHVDFFNQLTFTIPRLLQFMQTSESLIFNAVELAFDSSVVQIIADPHLARWKYPLYLGIMCMHLGWQVASAVQILSTLSPVLSVVEKLTLTHMENNGSLEWDNDVDPAQWRELLRPFSNVKVLHLENKFVGALSCSLRLEDGEMPLELLPNLEELIYSGAVADAFTPFINARQISGRPVRLASRF
jgi:hypothetical protein